MKTKFSLIVALFITGSAMSQTATVSNNTLSQASATVTKQASARSATSSNTTAKADTKADAKAQAAAESATESKQAVESGVESAKSEVKTGYENRKRGVAKDRDASAEVNAGSGAKTEAEYNKTGSNTSINTAGKVSAESSSASAINTLQKVEVTGKKAAKPSVNTAQDVKMKTHTKASANAKNAARVKAANRGLNTGVKSSISGHSAIGIR